MEFISFGRRSNHRKYGCVTISMIIFHRNYNKNMNLGVQIQT